MKTKWQYFLNVLALLSLATLNQPFSTACAQGTAFIYQGRLNDGANSANGIYDLRFAIYDASSAGAQQGSMVTNAATSVSNGLFTVTLDFGNQFPGAGRWLEIAVRTNGGGAFATLTPRQKIMPTPYALTAGNLASVIANNRVDTSLFATVGGGDGNAAGGLGSTVSGGIQNTNGGYYTTIGGGWANTIQNAASYSTIGGGWLNIISDGVATIGGGAGNVASGSDTTIGGGTGNVASGSGATIGGGYENVNSGSWGTIGGGDENGNGGNFGTVGGGRFNTNSGVFGSIGGGSANMAGGFATVPGGANNSAAGNYSFAAGQLAHALHQGAFVWADSQFAPFSSTANDQFLVRAAGGVGINTTNPMGSALCINGDTRLDAQALGYNEGLALNFPTNMSGSGGYGGIHFHSMARGGAFDANSIKWGIFYNYVPIGGIGGGGLAIVQNNATTRLYFATNGTTTFYSNPGQTTGVTLAAGGGAWTTVSDRNAKENFHPVNGTAVLEKVAALPLTTWNYKAQDARIHHLGPMAQDFKAAFDLGETDTGITTVDEEGVALAAIQGLNQKLNEKEAEITDLKQRLAALEKMFRNQSTK